MEKVHTQATAMLKGTEELLYQEGLESTWVFSLKSLMGNMINIYKNYEVCGQGTYRTVLNEIQY